MSDETAGKVTDFVNSRKDAGIIYFFGGEPLLHKEMIKKLKNSIKARQYVITTNGTLIDEDFIRWCRQNGVTVNVSHDGKDCSERGIEPEELNEKIRILKKYQRNILIQLVYNEKTVSSLAENIRYFQKLGVNSVSAVMEGGLTPQDTDKFGDVLMKAWHEASLVKGMEIIELQTKINRIVSNEQHCCSLCTQKLYINWDGKIYPCLNFQNRKDFYCGNISDGLNFKKTAEKYPGYAAFPDDCADCEIKKYCNNSCACRKMASSGSVNFVSEASCLEQQVLIMTALETIQRINEIKQNII